jgi:hypothetical protein
MNGSAHSTACHQPLIGSIHQGIDFEIRDVDF